MNTLQNPQLHKHIVRRCYCFFGKHEIINMEIQGKPIKYCKHCKYTEYLFLDGWHQIERNSYVQSFIDNNS